MSAEFSGLINSLKPVEIRQKRKFISNQNKSNTPDLRFALPSKYLWSVQLLYNFYFYAKLVSF